jgi:hypothetical protein
MGAMGDAAPPAPPEEAAAQEVVSFSQLFRFLNGPGDLAILTLAVLGSLGSGACLVFVRHAPAAGPMLLQRVAHGGGGGRTGAIAGCCSVQRWLLPCQSWSCKEARCLHSLVEP